MTPARCTIVILALVSIVQSLDRDECSSHCTIANKEDAHCWNQTLAFFEEALLNQIRGYIVVQARGIAKWRSKNNRYMDWKEEANKSVSRMIGIDPPNVKDEITDRSVYENIVQALISDAKIAADQDIEFTPPCPHGCEMGYSTYKNLFMGSLIGSCVLSMLILFLSIYNYRRMRNSAKQETVKAIQAYELSLTNKSKQIFKLIDVDI